MAASSVSANATTAAPSEAPLTIRLDSGQVRGTQTDKTHQFLGIPYAQPPVGTLRWAPPRRPEPWRGVRDATKPGNICPQAPPGGQPATNEDCLYVNVTTPREHRPGTKRPVMVWWHGGGFTHDSGNYYNAERIAEQGNVIVVTVNYRLGIFGYFGLPGLPGSGNFGFADQIAALKWTKRNARAFGGDPHNVTVFGQSAGAMAACALLTSPHAAGLVDKAALSSGSCLLDWPAGGQFPTAPAETPYIPVRQGNVDGRATAKKLGCDGDDELACMRAKPASELLGTTQKFANHLAYGTPLLPLNPATAVERGAFARVPVISGATRDEARSFVGGAIMANPDLITAKTYPGLLRRAYGDDADKVAARYPLTEYPSAGLAWATVLTDHTWACQTVRGNRELAEHVTVYPYEFADPNAPNVNGIDVPQVPQRSAHATDLPSLFDLHGEDFLGSHAQREMAGTMIDYWTRFAHTGNPNHLGAPKWAAGPGGALRFVPGAIERADVGGEHQCGFWNSLR
ncbi:MAG: carboxylesterase family protein [Pseudonocardiaceae bacterium]|nr:carboxylesterase family protein [Pseudonocardiaceae bacterium]